MILNADKFYFLTLGFQDAQTRREYSRHFLDMRLSN